MHLRSRIFRIVLQLILLPCFASFRATAQSTGAGQASGETTSTLQGAIRAGRLDELRWPVFSDFKVSVESFYRASGYGLAWVWQGRPTDRAQEMIQVFLQADGEGLDPEDYDGPLWSARLTGLQGSGSARDEARFDLALTVCAMRYISALRMGRIDPLHLKFAFDVRHKKLDLPSFLQQMLASAGDLKSELAQIEPPFAEYKDTRVALLKYEALAKQDDGEKLTPPPGILFPGGPYEGVARLARLLHLVGDLPQDAVIPADEKTYDGLLVDAVKRFQERHGLAANGYLTADTVDQLNIPWRDRVEQLKLALERFRWLRYNFTQPPVVVNLPGFRLYAFDKGGRVGLTMSVNVGDAYDFQTPVFENSIRYLVFRPYWNVPPKILRNEVIPDIAADRNFVRDHEMEVTTTAGAVVTAGVVSDSVLRQLRSGTLLVRQKPGADNPLGRLKIIFPNEHHVYLHDTAQGGEMFSWDQRALSHGCIHLEHPAELAYWLLRDKPGWTLERVQQAMQEGRDNVTVNLAAPVPILIVYTTAIAQAGGEVHFYRDIYGHDAALRAALAKGYPYP
jgi:murein L,D-transpeptidase YcbB/YkuD